MNYLISVLIFLFLIQCSVQFVVPGGKHFSKEHIHVVESGSVIEEVGELLRVSSSGKTKYISKINKDIHHNQLRHGPAWKAWAQYNNQSKVSFLSGRWTVPQIPQTNNGQILYFWNGIEPQDNSAVLQPVMQFGSTPAGGGSYWAIASWYVSSDYGVVVSKAKRITPGDIIYGAMTLNANKSWSVVGLDETSKISSSIVYKPHSSDYTWSYQVLETYSPESTCEIYPIGGNVTFSDIVVKIDDQKVIPNWTTDTKKNLCQEKAVVANPSTVTIQFDTN